MKKKTKIGLRRAVGYVIGLVLLYAPFGLYERGLMALLGEHGAADIHKLCFTMSVQSLLSGTIGKYTLGVALVSLYLLIIVTFFFGPLYCGKLCPVGALPEYLSKLMPKKLQMKLKEKTNPTPIRYGFLLAFALSPFLGTSLTCTFCGFSFMQRIMNIPTDGIGMLLSSTIITMLLWLVLGGLFNVGGRGWCNYFCPVGAFQSIIAAIGSKVPFTFKLKIDREKCRTCGACADICPMGSLHIADGALTHNVHNCIECGACRAICPAKALSYGTGKDGWYVKAKAPECEQAAE